MHKSISVNALFPTLRLRILSATCLHPDRWWYLSDLARHLAVRPSSLQREMSSLVAAGILVRRRDGNRVYFQPDRACPILSDLQGMLRKTVGVVDVMRDALEPFSARIDAAFVHGSLARGDHHNTSDVDLVVFGDIGLADLAVALQRAESLLLRPVNPTVYTVTDAREKLAAGHHFLRAILAGDKMFVLGRADELGSALGYAPGAAPPDEPRRD